MTAGSTSMQRLLVEGNDFTDLALPINTNPLWATRPVDYSDRIGAQTDTRIQVQLGIL